MAVVRTASLEGAAAAMGTAPAALVTAAGATTSGLAWEMSATMVAGAAAARGETRP